MKAEKSTRTTHHLYRCHDHRAKARCLFLSNLTMGSTQSHSSNERKGTFLTWLIGSLTMLQCWVQVGHRRRLRTKMAPPPSYVRLCLRLQYSGTNRRFIARCRKANKFSIFYYFFNVCNFNHASKLACSRAVAIMWGNKRLPSTRKSLFKIKDSAAIRKYVRETLIAEYAGFVRPNNCADS